MRSPAELLEFYDEQASSTTRWAGIHRSNRNWPLAVQNYDQAAKNRFFRALVAWRTGLLPPRPELQAAQQLSEEAVAFFERADVGPLRPLFDSVPGAYSAILLDRPDSSAVAEARRYTVRPQPRGVRVDQCLESLLIGALIANDPGDGAEFATELAGRKQMGLVSEIYAGYFALAALDGTDVSTADRITHTLTGLFARRRRDPYYAGGVHYEGGDMYNQVVIDFHLAAIWRVRGWDPSGLSEEERLHVEMP